MFDCIVIGAGPGGLVSKKELLEQGLSNVLCFEQASDIRGIFANAYDNLVLTSSSTMSMFSDFWIGDGSQHMFWSKEEAINYWRRYAQNFGVLDRIRFDSKVTAVTLQETEVWQIQLASGETFLSKKIVLAIGNNAIPNYPTWKNSLTDVEFSHSKEYRNAERFTGKNVLLVGGGESGSDIALEVSKVAKHCWVSLRSTTGYIIPRKRGLLVTDTLSNRILWGIPRKYGATLSKFIHLFDSIQFRDPSSVVARKLNLKVKAKKGVLGTYGTKTYSLPKAIVENSCKVVGEIMNVEDGGKTLHTADEKTLTDIDEVIFSTGYINHVSFLPEDLKKTDPRSLYKHMFHSKYRDKIVWIGYARPNLGSQFPIMEMQARLFALVCTGEKTLPKQAEMERVTCVNRVAWLEQFEHNAHRIRSLVGYFQYMNDVAGLIGCKPPLRKYFFSHPCIWLRMVFGITQATQFRLQGPGNKESLARELLLKLPMLVPTFVIKDALKKNFIYRSEDSTR